jgi:hypothetical protein
MGMRDIPQECGMGDCLCIRSDHIMLLVAQVDVARLEASERFFDHADFFLWSSVMDDDLCISA